MSPSVSTSYGFAFFESYGYPGGWRFRPRDCQRTLSSPGDGVDNDCDGRADEEEANGIDDDGDGFIDDDLDGLSGPRVNLAPIAEPAEFNTFGERLTEFPISLRRFLLPGYDPNDDPITFEITRPPGEGAATINGRILEYRPIYGNNARTVTLDVRATDGIDESDVVEIRIRINRNGHNCAAREQCANRPPFVGWPNPPQFVRLDDGETERLISGGPTSLHDPNRDRVGFEVISAPAGFTIDPDTGQWSLTVTRAHVGTPTAQLQILENGVAEFPQTVRLAIVSSDGTDGLPVFLSTPIESVFLDAAYDYPAQAVDPEGTEITYSLEQAPIWLNIDPTGVVSGLAIAQGEHPIVIRATDEAGQIADQAFTLVVFGAGPTILSTPIGIATQETLYTYNPEVVHATQGEPLLWQLILAPPGMTIDASSGAVRWTPTPSQLGSHSVRIEVADSAGLGDGQTFSIEVRDQSFAPSIDSTAPLRVHVDDYYFYQVDASDPDPGDVLSFSLTTAPAGMAIGETDGFIQWLPMVAGLFAVEVTVTDTAQNTAVQQFVIEVEPDFIAPQIELTASPATIAIGESSTLSVTLQGAFDPATLALTVDGVPLPLDANLTASYTATSVGGHIAIATVSDASGNVGQATVSIAVPDAADTAAPIAELTSVSDDDVFTMLHDVIGTATDDNPLDYRLSLRPTASSEFVDIHRGFAPVTAASLATLDATTLENGYYELRLLVTDSGGLTASDSRRIRIDGSAKVGIVQLSFVDMAIETAGIALNVIRTYDSRDKRSGDFGFGWNLDVRAGRVSHSRPVGEGFAIYTGDAFEFPCQRQFQQETHFTEVRLSADEWYLFRPRAVNGQAVSGSCTVDVIYEQVDGTRDGAELFILGESSARATPQTPTEFPNELTFGLLTDVFTGTELFDPQDVRLELADGRVIDFNADRGITFISDANGNQVFYERSFIGHSDGQSIFFDRDAQGRITTITDPMGHTVQYQYDTRGDLVGVADTTSEFTEYLYESLTPHHLTAIIDPGRQSRRRPRLRSRRPPPRQLRRQRGLHPDGLRPRRPNPNHHRTQRAARRFSHTMPEATF